ncbi:Actin cross-linking toxin VgrG1 [Burkholderia gladioli]|nr:Actin cross-linking toxin VgrG1 [Burkholderia gladioli]
MTAQDIIAAVFQEHPQAAGAYRFDERNAAPARSFCVQFEDDWNFVHRLLESEGWYYYFEHADDGKSHTLVVTDDLYSLKPLAAEQVEFYRAGISSQTDALVQWAGTRTLQSTSRSTQTFDYSSRTPGKSNLFRPSTIRASCRNKLRSTNTPALTPISTTRAATN